MAEIFDESSLGRAKAYLDANFDSVFHFPLRRALVDAIVQGGSVDKVASAVADGIAKVGMDRALDTVLMMDNHDVPRFVNEPGNTGAARSGTIRVPVPAAVAPPDASLVDELGDGAPVTTTLDGGRLVVDLPAHSAALYRRR